MQRILLTTLLAVSLNACTETTGTQITQAQASQFTPGVSKLTDVESKLGQPSQLRSNSDGTTTAEYDYTHLQANAATYVPIVGMFAGKTAVNQNTTNFLFDSNGVLKSSATSVGQSTMGATGTQ